MSIRKKPLWFRFMSIFMLCFIGLGAIAICYHIATGSLQYKREPGGLAFAENLWSELSSLDNLEYRLLIDHESRNIRALSAMRMARYSLNAEHGAILARAIMARPEVYLDRYRKSVAAMLVSERMQFSQSTWIELLCHYRLQHNNQEIIEFVLDTLYQRLPSLQGRVVVTDSGITVDDRSICDVLQAIHCECCVNMP
ncbi:MAG: hypothetical protein KF866_12070 [Phycisphaeraceae bacterium]|nr:hypothetical protein [Phycisphaeraceae bacterium]